MFFVLNLNCRKFWTQGKQLNVNMPAKANYLNGEVIQKDITIAVAFALFSSIVPEPFE